ncbi:hypothetical protein KP509_13G015900 [Ceratopteris richardii]|uniref:J domain-containing protein n=1 Tax=Ceratopteris richardii TaxID=49495 RepID=A0A8T2TGV9_CERRI|nr:hypothetical protein KP509_13G015900 [Ceratopteris richardii]
MSWPGTGESADSDLENLSENKKDLYKVLEVNYDASDESIRTNYLRLALKWHPDKHKGEAYATVKFQEISEAYRVLSDPIKRLDYDMGGAVDVQQYTIIEYLNRFKGLILTCNGLGIDSAPQWASHSVQVGYHPQS